MKIILSRKVFDTANGGFPSPVLPNGKLISLPIPSDDNIYYSDLKLETYGTYYDLMMDLKGKIKFGKSWHDLKKKSKCHLDPDIYRKVTHRNKGWKPIFGQIDAAQTHLENEGVKGNEGSIFLFFGTFRQTELRNNRLMFIPNELEKHIIFGYLQIGEITKITEGAKFPHWMNYHPHTSDRRRAAKNNTVYIARDFLSWNPRFSGAGTFYYRDSLVLTKEGCSKTKWNLNEMFKHVRISCHSDKNWKEEGYFESNDIGQEFVIHADKNVEKWVKDLICNSKIA